MVPVSGVTVLGLTRHQPCNAVHFNVTML
jgi:hypothetical protein